MVRIIYNIKGIKLCEKGLFYIWGKGEKVDNQYSVINNCKNFTQKFNFLFDDSEDIEKIIKEINENIGKFSDSETICKEAKGFITQILEKMAPITLLSHIGFVDLTIKMGGIEYPFCIQQFQIDYLQALSIKYCKLQRMYSMSCEVEYIIELLKLISIYNMAFEDEITTGKLQAGMISSHFRTRRFQGMNQIKLDMIKELFASYDRRADKGDISILGIIQMFENLSVCVQKRIAAIQGRLINPNNMHNIFIFKIGDFLSFYPEKISDNRIIEIINLFVTSFESLKNHTFENIFSENPIFENFIIQLDESKFFLPNLGNILDKIINICETIIRFNGNETLYQNIRAEFLEEKVAITSKKAFPDAEIFTNSQWDKERHGENDCTLILENYAIIFEAKGSNIAKQAKKGFIRELNDVNKKLIMEADEQANSFAELLADNYGKILTLKLKGGGENSIDLTNVRNTIKIGITLSEIPLQTMNFYKVKNGTHIPIISIFQLSKIYECLKFHCEKVDYLEKRMRIQKNVEHSNEEEDLLYTYLLTGFNTSDKYYTPTAFNRVYKFCYTEKEVTRNHLIRTSMFNQILCDLENSRDYQWLDKCISILEIPPLVQMQIERDLFINNILILYDNIAYRKKAIVVEVAENIKPKIDIENKQLALHIKEIGKLEGKRY